MSFFVFFHLCFLLLSEVFRGIFDFLYLILLLKFKTFKKYHPIVVDPTMLGGKYESIHDGFVLI